MTPEPRCATCGGVWPCGGAGYVHHAARAGPGDGPPFTAVIRLGIWAHGGRAGASAVLEQLVADLEGRATDNAGGVSVHHRVRSVELFAGTGADAE